MKKGSRHSVETRRKISQSKTGQRHTEKTKMKMSKTRSRFSWFNELKDQHKNDPETLEWLEANRSELELSNDKNVGILNKTATYYQDKNTIHALEDQPDDSQVHFYAGVGYEILSDTLNPETTLLIFEKFEKEGD